MVEKTLAECIDTKIMGGDSAMACPECGNEAINNVNNIK